MKTSPHTRLVDETHRETDTFLAEFITERRARAEAIAPSYGELWQSIELLVGAGGKRLRPYMLAMSYQTFGGGRLAPIVPAMAAQELFHQAVLIHDDIIDRDTIRYGVANITGQYEAIYTSLIDTPAERRHFANSAALLAGDLLLSSAYQVLGRLRLDHERVMLATETFAEAIFDVSGGELLDTETAFRGEERVDPRTIARYKTARYSFVSPLVMGAQLAGADAAMIAGLREYGEQLGIAFQLRDDLLGVYGDSETTGKSTSSDICEGKRTQLIKAFDARATTAQATRFYEIFHRLNATEDDINEARHLLEVSGARMAVEEQIEASREAAVAALQQLTIADEWRQAFLGLADRATKRSS